MSAAVRENLTRDEARNRATIVSDVAIDVELDLTRGDVHFGATSTITFAATAGGETFLDCTAHEVHDVVLNGTALDLDTVVSPTRIALPGLAADNTLTVVATMAYLHEGRGLHFFRDPSDDRVYLHSQFEPFDAHLVYPCFDQPDLKAPFTLAVEAPAAWVVVSNNPVQDQPEDGAAGRWTFTTTPPLSPYVTVVVAGGYESVHTTHVTEAGELPLGLYIRRSLRDYLDDDELFELTRQGFDWFNHNFGIAYPFDKYDQLFVPEFSAGAMENPGAVTFTERYLFRGPVTDNQRERRAETLLHEMAHMWFGDLVTMRWWDDLWLNESFATFAAVLSQVEGTRFTHAWTTFLDAEKAWAKYQDQLPTTHPIAADMVDIESVHQNFDGITYAKGASVLRQLVAYVGQEDFLAGVRAYFVANKWDNAELADFLGALEDASGRDLATWRDAWLSTTGVNTLSVDHDIADDGTFSRFVVHQSAPEDHPTIRPHRLAIGVYDDDGDGRLVRTHRVELDVDAEAVEVPELVGVDAGRLVLPNDDDLTFAKLALDERTVDAVVADLHRFADPMPRALAWSATWDMLRDAQLSATDYVELVLANIAQEDQIGVLSRLHQRATGAADRYADRSHRDTLATRLADQAMAELDASEPGSEEQLAWLRHLAATATSSAQLDRLRAVLDGSEQVDGLALEADLRWTLVVALARAGRLGLVEIQAELDRDPTDLGDQQATAARAARPDPDAKRQAWDRLLGEEELSHTMARQLWAGMQQLTQPDLVAPYADPYFAALDDVWSTRSTEWAIEFATGMFPHAAASADLLAAAERARDRDDLPGPLRRVLVEQVDVLERTLAARAADAPSA